MWGEPNEACSRRSCGGGPAVLGPARDDRRIDTNSLGFQQLMSVHLPICGGSQGYVAHCSILQAARTLRARPVKAAASKPSRLVARAPLESASSDRPLTGRRATDMRTRRWLLTIR